LGQYGRHPIDGDCSIAWGFVSLLRRDSSPADSPPAEPPVLIKSASSCASRSVARRRRQRLSAAAARARPRAVQLRSPPRRAVRSSRLRLRRWHGMPADLQRVARFEENLRCATKHGGARRAMRDSWLGYRVAPLREVRWEEWQLAPPRWRQTHLITTSSSSR
jgi:hypothetical protein